MEIKKGEAVIKELEAKLGETFVGHSLTEHSLEEIQDVIEHKLLSYSKKDIEEERFLQLSVNNYSKETTSFCLFIENEIFITVTMTITVDGNDFTKIGDTFKVEVETLGILETN